MLSISIDHKVDMAKILSYPQFISCHFDGAICKTQKSTLMKSLEKNLEHNPPDRTDILLIDGFFTTHHEKCPKNLWSYFEKNAANGDSTLATRFNNILDQYFSASIKDYETSLRHESAQLDFKIALTLKY